MSYEIMHPDVSPELIQRIDPQVSSGKVFFYAEKRHPLEILPEALTSLWLVFSLMALLLNVKPFSACEIGFASLAPSAAAGRGTDECRWLVGVIAVISYSLALIFPFGIELIRWKADVYYLTQDGWSQWRFDFGRFTFRNKVMGFVTSTDVKKPMSFRLLGLDVGTVAAIGVDESRWYVPLMPRPFILQTRIREAANYKPPAPNVGDGILWRN